MTTMRTRWPGAAPPAPCARAPTGSAPPPPDSRAT
uniref:Uncharacterized protein n=1 Tax=Oryza punctata TaxID=4537 RepID=A0A0E0LD30_ORYPU